MVYIVDIDEETMDAKLLQPNGYNLIIPHTTAIDIINGLIKFYMQNTQDTVLQWNNFTEQHFFDDFDTSNDSKKVKTNKPGYVYIFECNRSSSPHTIYKIGFSTNVEKRFEQVVLQKNMRGCIIFQKYFDNAYKIEQTLHKELDEFRLYGEWYTFTKNKLKEIMNDLLSLDKEYMIYE